MHLCPECDQIQNQILDQPCSSCKTPVEHLDGMPVLLSSKDKQNPMCKGYKETYERIAVEDLEQSFQHLEFLEIQTEKLFSYLPQRKGMSICEVGVGQGWLLKKLPALDPSRLVGVDIAPAYLKKLIEDKIPFEPLVANAENLPFQEEFDLVVSTDVLEHVLSVGNYLHCMHRSLKKNGIFVVRVPYLEDYNRYSRFKGHKYETMHLRNFSKQTLEIVLKGAGFRVRKMHFDGFEYHRFRSWTPIALRSYICKIYGSYILLAALPNWIGRMCIRPGGITAICEKI